jgi:hypothetical protein
MNVSEVVFPAAQLDSKNPAHIFSVPPQVAVLMASKSLSKACVVASVVTSKAAICGHFKTGHMDWPET